MGPAAGGGQLAGNLYRRGKTWWARIQSAGREHRRSLRTAIRSEALERLRAFRSELSHARFYGEPRHRLREAAVKWGEEVLPGLSPSTATRYGVSLRQIEAILGDMPVEQIDRKAVAKVAGRQGATNATRRRDLTALSSVLRAALNWGWIESNPARAFDRAMLPERRDAIRIPEGQDIARVVDRCPPGLGRLVRFLETTGCREEEAAGLEHPQLDLRRGTATFLRTKTMRPRTILLRSSAFPDGPGTGVGTPRKLRSSYVFWHGEGERYRNVASRLAAIIGKLAEKGKIKRFRVHDLRHRFAVLWLRNGGDIYALSRHLGHSSVKTTEIYLGYVPGGVPAQESAQWRRSGTGTKRRSRARNP